MNEPGTHIEIEDVLTSIRRLVSQDATSARAPAVPHRAAAPAAVPPPEAEDAAQDAACLVLTPALRVEPEAEAAGEANAGEEAAPVAEVPDADIVEELSRLETSIAEMEAAVAGHGAEFGAQAGGDDSLEADPLPESLEADPLPETAPEPEPERDVAPEAGDDAEPADLSGAEPLPAEPRDDREEAEAPFAEDVAPEDLEALLLDMADFAEAEAEAGAEAEVGVEVADPDAEGVAVEETEPAPDQAVGFDAEAEDAVEDDEGDPDLRDEAWTEDQGAMDWAEAALNLASTGSGPRRLHLSDALEEDRRPEILRSSYQTLRDEYARDEDLPGIEAALDDEPLMDGGLIDEEALRMLVAQLIREELRGVLGERITRNVRKLVRREIQRALMGEDYE